MKSFVNIRASRALGKLNQRMLCLVDPEHGIQDVVKNADGQIALACGCVRHKLTSELVAERYGQ
jgi:hypothetical protein